MEHVCEVIVVEGKYDAIRLHSAVDATVIETAGFGIFKDKDSVAMLRHLAKTRGLLILTDSDGAGFVIRNFLNGAITDGTVKHAYIPEISGKERRKDTPSKEGILGVEGIDNAVIIEALRRAGATFDSAQNVVADTCHLTKADLFEAGLVGTKDSAAKRAALQKALGLPAKLSPNRLLTLLNTAYSQAEYTAALQSIRP